MKKITRLFFLFAFICTASNLSAATSLSNPKKSVNAEKNISFTVEEFLAYSPKQYELLTGKKLKLTEKVSFKIAQQKLKKAVKKGELSKHQRFLAGGINFDDFNLLGFILGFLLGPIGVLITYVVDDSNLIKWAWLGFGTWAIILIIALLL